MNCKRGNSSRCLDRHCEDLVAVDVNACPGKESVNGKSLEFKYLIIAKEIDEGG